MSKGSQFAILKHSRHCVSTMTHLVHCYPIVFSHFGGEQCSVLCCCNSSALLCVQCSLCAVRFIIGAILCCSPHSGNSFRNSSSGRNNNSHSTSAVQCILGAVHLIIGTMEDQWRVEWSVVTENFASMMKYF